MVQPQRGDGQDGKAGLVDEKRILVGAVQGAAVLDDAQAAGGGPVDHPVVQDEHRVGDVFLDAVAGQAVLLAALAGDDGGDAPVFQPAEQTPQLGAQDQLVGEPGKQGLHRVQHHPFGADRIDGKAQADEQPLQVVVAGFLDLAALDEDVVDGELLFALQVRQVKPQGRDVSGELLGGFLKGHEDAGLVELHRPPHQKLHAQKSFAAAGAAAHQGAAPPGQTAIGDLVKALDARGAFGQGLGTPLVSPGQFRHAALQEKNRYLNGWNITIYHTFWYKQGIFTQGVKDVPVLQSMITSFA